jgi:hypothetical protein
LMSKLSDTHHIISLVFGAEDLGWPIRRPRTFSTGLNEATTAWAGPKDASDEFKKLFFSHVKADGSIFMGATEAAIVDDVKRRAELRGRVLPDNFTIDHVPEILPQHIYPPGAVLRLQEHARYRAEVESTEDFEGTDWFADLEQWPKTGTSRPGRCIPCQLTHGTIYSFNHKRSLIPFELLQAHGFNLLDGARGRFQCHLKSLFEGASYRSLQVLSGNGWHLPSMASWMFYVLSNAVKLNRVMTVNPERPLLRRMGASAEELEFDDTFGEGSDGSSSDVHLQVLEEILAKVD